MSLAFQLLYYILQLPYLIGRLLVMIFTLFFRCGSLLIFLVKQVIEIIKKLVEFSKKVAVTAVMTVLAFGQAIVTALLRIRKKLWQLGVTAVRSIQKVLTSSYKHVHSVPTQLPLNKPSRKNIWLASASVFTGLVTTATVIGWLYIEQLPYPTELSQFKQPKKIEILDTNGVIIFQAFSHESANKTVTPSHFIAATTQELFDHNALPTLGIDVPSTIHAMINILLNKEKPLPGSITQQLARRQVDLHLSAVNQLVAELILTVRLEQSFSSDQQLALFLSTTPVGTSVGIEQAAHTYFGKSITELSKAESVYLLSLLNQKEVELSILDQGFNNDRYQQVIAAARQAKVLSTDEVLTLQTPATPLPQAVKLRAPNAVSLILQEVGSQLPTSTSLYDGLILHSTINLEYQNEVQRLMIMQFETASQTIPQASVLITEPETGAVRTFAGTPTAESIQNDLVTLAKAYQVEANHGAAQPLFTVQTAFTADGRVIALTNPQESRSVTSTVRASSNVAATYTDSAVITVWVDPTAVTQQPTVANQLMDALANHLLSQSVKQESLPSSSTTIVASLQENQ